MTGEGRYHAVLIGGRYDRLQVELTDIPTQIEVAGKRYRRLNDPDTGDYLGGYMSDETP